jgi:energy-coupling factor transport system permease protein
MELTRYVTIGQYIPRDSPVHRLDPRSKIAAVTVLTVAVFVVRDFSGYGLLTLFLLGVVLASQIPLGYLLRGLRPVLFLLLMTLVLNVFFSGIQGGTVLFQFGPLIATREAVMRAVFIGYRLVALVLVTSLLTFTTSPVQLTDGIERILRPFRRLGVPAHELAMMMTIALRFIPTLLEETEKIMKAQMARGAEFEHGNIMRRARALVPVLVPLFVSAFRRADELALAMEARCYRGGEHRTRMKELHLAPRDAVALVLTILASFVFTIPYPTWQALLR